MPHRVRNALRTYPFLHGHVETRRPSRVAPRPPSACVDRPSVSARSTCLLNCRANPCRNPHQPLVTVLDANTHTATSMNDRWAVLRSENRPTAARRAQAKLVELGARNLAQHLNCLTRCLTGGRRPPEPPHRGGVGRRSVGKPGKQLKWQKRPKKGNKTASPPPARTPTLINLKQCSRGIPPTPLN